MEVDWGAIAETISSATGVSLQPLNRQAVGGGSINDCYRLSAGSAQYFVKCNRADRLDMFEAERDGLNEILQAGIIRAPHVICCGTAVTHAYIVLEYLDLSGRAGRQGSIDFGHQLAAMHQVTAGQFGWFRNNTIGATPQINDAGPDWVEFWRQQRLFYQRDLLVKNGFGGSLHDRLSLLGERLGEFFYAYTPRPSLLHGDLWSGNYGLTAQSEPVIFDPAVYYGDREADIAMTELFGGFPADFYGAYNEALPLDAGYAVRKTLYNLYHILNHVNLFGGGYLAQAENMVSRLLSELRS